MKKIYKNLCKCEKSKDKYAKTCKECYFKSLKGLGNPNYIHGKTIKNNCIDCDIEISCRAIRCYKCEGIQRRGRTIYYCKDCKTEISYCSFHQGQGRCKSCANKGRNNPAWIDGRTSLRDLIKQLEEYFSWRKECLQRDSYICQDCNSIKRLEVHHHKKSFALLMKEFLQEYNQFSPIEDKETLIRLAINWKPFWDIDNGK